MKQDKCLSQYDTVSSCVATSAISVSPKTLSGAIYMTYCQKYRFMYQFGKDMKKYYGYIVRVSYIMTDVVL